MSGRTEDGVAGRAKAIADAEEAGLEVVYSNPKLLQIDCDTEEDFEEAKKRLLKIKDTLKYTRAYVTRSKSNHWHIYVELQEPLLYMERILLQASLGSDWLREFLNWNDQQQSDADIECLFFEKPDTKVTVLFEENPLLKALLKNLKV